MIQLSDAGGSLLQPGYSSAGPDTAPYKGAATHGVKPHASLLTDVYVPEPVLRPLPASAEDKEDWDEEYSELFEWVGMACLGSQR